MKDSPFPKDGRYVRSSSLHSCHHKFPWFSVVLNGRMQVLWTVYGTHYNEEYFKDPLRYDPSRFQEFVPPYVYVPFGGGPRTCAGYQLAKLNILIFLHYVLTAYHWSLLHPNEPIIMDPLPLPSKGMPISISPKLITNPN